MIPLVWGSFSIQIMEKKQKGGFEGLGKGVVKSYWLMSIDFQFYNMKTVMEMSGKKMLILCDEMYI